MFKRPKKRVIDHAVLFLNSGLVQKLGDFSTISGVEELGILSHHHNEAAAPMMNHGNIESLQLSDVSSANGAVTASEIAAEEPITAA